MEEKLEMVRVNTRISPDLNDWLNEESAKTGLSKSAIMMIAAESYRKEKIALKGMVDMSDLVTKISELEKAVKRNDPE